MHMAVALTLTAVIMTARKVDTTAIGGKTKAITIPQRKKCLAAVNRNLVLIPL